MSEQLVKVVTISPHKYAGRWYRIGEELMLSDSQAADLVATRYVVRINDPLQDTQRYERRDLRPKR